MDFRRQLDGFANVHADHPQIGVAAFLVCKDDILQAGGIISITSTPSFPVGQTLDLFLAAQPPGASEKNGS